MDRLPRPIAGFVGNITGYKLDFDLIAAAAEQNPKWSFVLIGPIGRGDPSTDVAKLAGETSAISADRAAWTALVRALFNLDEVVTKG